jgi:alanine racemase
MKAPFTEMVSGSASVAQGTPLANRPTCARIDLEALSRNFKEAAHRAEGSKVLAVVKAQAYGHGAVPVSQRLISLGAHMLGVALIEEGRELREAGIIAPILVMGAMFPSQAEAVATLQLTPVLSTLSFAQALSLAAESRKTTIPVHVKIDTGMGRIGVPPEEALEFITDLRRLPGIQVQGLMTHFADADLQDKDFASKQIDRFETLIAQLDAKGIDSPLRHAAYSAAVLSFPRALCTMVRPGLMLYGYDPLEAGSGHADLTPVLSLETRVAFMKKVPAGVPISYGRTFVTKRESVIATLPIGYADGYSRGLSNKGEVLIRGMRAPIVGRVCMDMCMVDVTELPGVREGDEAVLIGVQGKERITADDIAGKTGTIAYEVLCGISSRVPRIYQ